MIQVEGLTKEYGARLAIDHITFNAEKGEILGFLGPNGAGKTTTMRILSGYMPPTSGKAEVAGFDVVEQSLEVRRRVGYLPETVPLYPDMSVFEYLQFMANLRRLQHVEDRVDEVLEMVHMEDRSESFIGNLSKGMRQRVGLAQALLHSPDVLILDEPTIGLDPAQIIEVRNLIREIGKEHTVLLSTHILSEAQTLCNRVLIINKGHIVVEDSPEQLKSRLMGSQRISIQIRDGKAGLSEALLKVPGVIGVADGPDGNLEFESAAGMDVRPDVARMIINAGYDLLEMRPVGLSLEDIFMQLTRDENGTPSTESEEIDDEFDDVEEVEVEE